MNLNIDFQEKFETRHIAPNEKETAEMLKTVGADSLAQLVEQTIPEKIRLKSPLNLPAPESEYNYLKRLKQVSLKNKVFKS